jgi:hypothetical protein
MGNPSNAYPTSVELLNIPYTPASLLLINEPSFEIPITSEEIQKVVAAGTLRTGSCANTSLFGWIIIGSLVELIFCATGADSSTIL